MQKKVGYVIALLLMSTPLFTQTKRLWVLQSSGEMVEYDPTTFAPKQHVKLPPEALKSPSNIFVNRQGQIDPNSSEADAKVGAFEVEKRLFLFRNLEHLHWVPLIASERDPATGAWRGGDLDGAGDGRGLGVAGNCVFVGHSNGAGVKHAVNILKIQPDPAKQQPVVVGVWRRGRFILSRLQRKHDFRWNLRV